MYNLELSGDTSLVMTTVLQTRTHNSLLNVGATCFDK